MEKDFIQKERDLLNKRVKELEEQLNKEKKEKMAAQVEAQHYCDEIVATRLLKEKLEDDLSKVEALRNEAREEGKRAATVDIDSRLKAAREEGREEIKTEFVPLIAEFNARVLMHRDLTFLGDGYLESLAEALETLIQIRKAESGVEEVDEEALVKEFLRRKEPSDLSAAKALYSKGSPSRKGKEVATDPFGVVPTVHVPTQSASRSILDPFEQHVGYDPDAPGLGIHVLSPIPEGGTPWRLRTHRHLVSNLWASQRSFSFPQKLLCSNTFFLAFPAQAVLTPSPLQGAMPPRRWR